MKEINHNRRNFLLNSGKLALLGTATPFISSLSLMNQAAAAGTSDYKALVCIFLYGGNDYANTVIPYDDTYYNMYHNIRSGEVPGQGATGIAIAKSDLTNTLLNPKNALPNSRQYALHPSLTNVSRLFNSGAAAIQLNVGPLIVPINRTQYDSLDRVNYPLPPKLFSHNDQQSLWQSSSPEGSTIGWGGNIADSSLSNNSNSTFTCISVSGNTVFLAGDSTIAYNISTSGAIPINGVTNSVYGSSSVQNVLKTLVQQPSSNILANEYNKITTRSITCESQVSSALANTNITTPFDKTNSLANQLLIVAKLIAARNTLGNKRQVYFVSLGGFDLHDNLIDQHAKLLTQVDSAVSSFYNATVELGVSDKVTAFTASDFGRTLSSNGDGSDHGWGSHHLIVGGAVNGQNFYGTAPSVDIGTTMQDHVGQGRLIPSTSVDQYAATLAKWHGVPDAELYNILPNLKNFGIKANRLDYPTDIGFMKPA